MKLFRLLMPASLLPSRFSLDDANGRSAKAGSPPASSNEIRPFIRARIRHLLPLGRIGTLAALGWLLLSAGTRVTLGDDGQPARKPDVPKLVIVKAEYGLEGGKTIDVTKQVSDMVKDGELSVKVPAENFAPLPAGCGKGGGWLRVTCTLNGMTKRKTAYDGRMLTIEPSYFRPHPFTTAAGCPTNTVAVSSPYRILFDSYFDENWDIWSVRPDGADRRNITNTPDIHESYPMPSPDGKRIAFVVDECKEGTRSRSLWLMNADGTDRRMLSNPGREPVWSPDGKRIAFARQQYARFSSKSLGSWGLFFYNLDDGSITEHPNKSIGQMANPSWVGNWIFRNGGTTIEANGDRLVNVPYGGCRPWPSEDGKRLIHSGGYNINMYDMEITAEGPRISKGRFVHEEKDQSKDCYWPRFSPDRRYVVFSISGPSPRAFPKGPGLDFPGHPVEPGTGGPWDVWIKEIDSPRPPQPLTCNPELSNKHPVWTR